MDRCANSEAESSYADGVEAAEKNREDFEDALCDAADLIEKAEEEFDSMKRMYHIEDYTFSEWLDER